MQLPIFKSVGRKAYLSLRQAVSIEISITRLSMHLTENIGPEQLSEGKGAVLVVDVELVVEVVVVVVSKSEALNQSD